MVDGRQMMMVRMRRRMKNPKASPGAPSLPLWERARARARGSLDKALRFQEQSLEAPTIQDSHILVPGGIPSLGEEELGKRGEMFPDL